MIDNETSALLRGYPHDVALALASEHGLHDPMCCSFTIALEITYQRGERHPRKCQTMYKPQSTKVQQPWSVSLTVHVPYT